MPLTVLSAPADTEVLVLEMGMNHFHEIERLSQSANPNLAIVSKIGTSHIGILGSRENIARAKAEIVQGMCAAGDFLPLLVLGGEDDFTPFIRDAFAQPAGIDVMLAGVSDDDEVRARDIRVDDEGRPVFTLDFGQGETIDTMLAIPGVQSVPNAVKAAAVAYRLGVTPEQIDAAFRGLTITGHRQEIKHAKSGARVIDDSYNASAESMAAGLDLLCSLSCTGSRMAILGEMGEMGDEAPRMHELVGAYAAAKKLDMLACVGGELAQLMADAARMMGMDEDRIQVFSDYQQVLDRMGGALENMMLYWSRVPALLSSTALWKVCASPCSAIPRIQRIRLFWGLASPPPLRCCSCRGGSSCSRSRVSASRFVPTAPSVIWLSRERPPWVALSSSSRFR